MTRFVRLAKQVTYTAKVKIFCAGLKLPQAGEVKVYHGVLAQLKDYLQEGAAPELQFNFVGYKPLYLRFDAEYAYFTRPDIERLCRDTGNYFEVSASCIVDLAETQICGEATCLEVQS